ncbi:MAG: ATP-binding protein, partial [Clostridiales bacterium]|nr:ATP-binding protein [Clostridiales bacterium]
MKQDRIIILDLGGTDNTVVARAIRALGVYSEIYPHDITAAELKAMPGVRGIILNGGENRIVDGKAVDVLPELYDCNIPMLAANHPTAHCSDNRPAWPQDERELIECLRPFVFDVCGAKPNWNMKNFIAEQVEALRAQIGNKKVLLALSGGVDSSVVAALLIRAVGDQLTCIHVNHGLLRKGEPEQVCEVFGRQLGANLVYVDASKRFLDKLAGVADPEQKRKIIGAEFIRVFEEEARKLDGIQYLGQGTIYP